MVMVGPDADRDEEHRNEDQTPAGRRDQSGERKQCPDRRGVQPRRSRDSGDQAQKRNQ